MYFLDRTETKEGKKARLERECRERKERKRRLKEARLENLRKANRMRVLRQELSELDREALVEKIIGLIEEKNILRKALERKSGEIIDARHRGYRKSREDYYNSLSQKEKDDIEWQRQRASDSLVN